MHIRQLLWKMLSGTLTGLRLRASDKEIIKLEKFVITGGKPLHGEVTISGAKNAAVGVLPATILAADVCVIENLPDISDVSVSLKILSTLGAQVKMLNRNTYEIDTRHLVTTNVPDDLSRQMRASYYFLGALLSGLLASCLKSAVGYPRISVTVPSIVIMVPGLYFYRAIYNLGILSLMDSATWFADAILIIVALPLGLIFARIVTDKTFRYCT